jgi:hypothetical protein
VKLAVGPPWLRVTVTARDAEMARRLAAHLAQGGAEQTENEEGRIVVVEAGAETGGDTAALSGREGSVFRLRRAGGEGWFDLHAGRGEVRLTPRSGAFFETFLRQVFLWESYRMGGLVLHSVTFADGGEAIVSSGPSESGKSTLARMLGETFTVYSDEMNVVAADGRVWALPFRGTGVDRVRAGGGRLAALTFHRPGAVFASAAVEAAEAARNLWPNVFVPEGADAELKLVAFERAAALAQRAPAYVVDVPLDAAAAREGFYHLFKTLCAKEGDYET